MRPGRGAVAPEVVEFAYYCLSALLERKKTMHGT